MTKTKGVLYGLGIIGAFALTWMLQRKRDAKTDLQTVSQTLPAGDKAKVIIDEKHHEVITVTRDTAIVGRADRTVIKKTFLSPDASIETKPDGTVVVASRSWGTETSPWVGVSVDTEAHGRGALGLNLFYIQRWETGVGVSVSFVEAKDVRVFVSGSYNVYSNLLLTATIDNHHAVGIGIALKF